MPALVPSAKNDEFALPDSEIYILTVPFTSDYKHVINFANKTAQINAFKSYMNGKDHLHFTKCNIVRKERSLILRQPFGQLLQQGNDMYQFNYMIYQNPNLDNKWWYCFIDNCEYRAKDTVEIFFSVDVWQTFHTDITYRKCMIERCHIPRANDSFRLWNEPEPLSVIPYGESGELGDTYVGNWSVYAVAICQAVPTGGVEEDFWHNANKPKFQYGNTINRETRFGDSSSVLYALDLNGSSNLGTAYNSLLSIYNQRFSDHRNDILCIQLLPYFIYRNTEFTVPGGMESGFKGADGNYTASATVAEFNMNENTIAPNNINYTPRNKKLLSSLCRSFVVYNKNGFLKIIKPEDITASNNSRFRVTASGKPIGLEQVQLETTDLRFQSTSYWYLPYNLKFSIAYNENDGAYQEMKQLQSAINFGLSAGSAIATMGAGTTMGNVASAGVANAFNTSLESNINPTIYRNNINLRRAEDIQTLTGFNAGKANIESATDIFSSGISLYQSLVETHTAGRSTGNDLLQYTPDNMRIRIREVYPTLEQARICDDFLDIYGYARNEILPLGNNIATRSNWNYVKTVNCNLTCECSTNYENKLRSIFNNGVTIWHSFAKLISGYNSVDSDDKNQ